MYSCKKEVQEPPAVTVLDSFPTEQVQPQLEEAPKRRLFWASDNVKLPAGKIVEKDCAGCKTGEKKPVYSDNYVVVRRSSDSLMVLIKDIDEDVYLSIRVGEYVQ